MRSVLCLTHWATQAPLYAQRIFNFPWEFLFDSKVIYSVLFRFQGFGDFPPMFLLLLSTLIPMCFNNTIFFNYVFSICWGFLFGEGYSLSWYLFHRLFKRILNPISNVWMWHQLGIPRLNSILTLPRESQIPQMKGLVYKTVPPSSTSNTNHKSRLLTVLLTNWL